jgi:hypothetical protein
LGEQLQFFFAIVCARGTLRVELGWCKQGFEEPFAPIACNKVLAHVFAFFFAKTVTKPQPDVTRRPA